MIGRDGVEHDKFCEEYSEACGCAYRAELLWLLQAWAGGCGDEAFVSKEAARRLREYTGEIVHKYLLKGGVVPKGPGLT